MPKIKSMREYPFWGEILQFRHRYALGLLSLIGVDLINACLPLLIRSAIDAVPAKNKHALLMAGALYFSLMLLQALGRYLWRVYLIGTSHLVAQQRRVQLYSHLQRLPITYFQQMRAGDLMSRATNDIESVRMAMGPGILVTLDAILSILFILPVMLYLSVKLTLLAFAFYPAVPWITAWLGNRIDTLFERMQGKMSLLSAFTQETLGAIRLVKSLVLESHCETQFRQMSRSYAREGIRQAQYQAIFSPALGLLTLLGTFLILLEGGREVVGGMLTVGTLVAFQRYVVQLSWPMEAIGWAVTLTREGTSAHRRLTEVMAAEEVVAIRTRAHRFAGKGLLEISDLSFALPTGGAKVQIDHLVLHAGQKIGLVGPVGAGKTTLFNLILRLYEPPSDSIYLGGTDICAIPVRTLRRMIASVEQQVFLFSESIAHNIRVGSPSELRISDVRRLADLSCFLEEVEEFPTTFDTILGERGVNLSGGQKQRLGLARALARDAQLLLLDDCFSAVDVAVEDRIIRHFFETYPNMSILFASHRLSIMPKMDTIWLMDDGRITGVGTHQQLLKENPLYQDLWEKNEIRKHTDRLEIEINLPGKSA